MEWNPEDERNDLYLILAEKFAGMGDPVEAPPELKDQVFSTLDTLGLATEILDLFTMKFVHSHWVLLSGTAYGHAAAED